MNHKRKKPKDQRAGCIMCKPSKSNAFKGQFAYQTRQERFAIVSEDEQIEEFNDRNDPNTNC